MVEFDENSLKDFLHNMMRIKSRVTTFFKEKQVSEALDNNDFEKFYELEQHGYTGYNTSDITTILYLSDIDPLKYLYFIPKNCFTGSPIKLIDIPNNITQIKYKVFSWCHALESVILPNSIKYIESNIFIGCDKLKEIHYMGTIEQYNKITASADFLEGSLVNKIICLDGIIEVS